MGRSKCNLGMLKTTAAARLGRMQYKALLGRSWIWNKRDTYTCSIWLYIAIPYDSGEACRLPDTSLSLYPGSRISRHTSSSWSRQSIFIMYIQVPIVYRNFITPQIKSQENLLYFHTNTFRIPNLAYKYINSEFLADRSA